MIKTDEYLEPLKYYESSLKDTHKENVEKFFEELTKKSGVNIEENQDTCKKYYQEKEKSEKVKKKMGGIIAVEVILIILAVAAIIGAIVFFVNKAANPGLFTALAIVCIVVGIALFLLVILVLRKKRKNFKKIIEELEKKMKKLENEAWAQMAPLNNSFDELMAPHLMTKSAPLIQIDDNLESLTEERIVEQFKCPLDLKTSRSTLVVQSGNINTNPFIFRQVLVMKMEPEIYTGTLVITYTRTVSDGNGGTTTTTVTQTLTAHVTRPKPHYKVETSLNYYTDVAGNLSFERTPAGYVGKDDKQMEKIAYKKDKEESKKAEKAVKKGENYTKFANSKFEAYLNATGRDNELEYRFLFTPLAQQNYCYNFSKQDDIYYTKIKCQNIVQSLHDNDKDYSGAPLNYFSFDYEKIKDNFINYNTSFFEGIYLDFVPLLSIPAFHENQSAPYIVPRNRVNNMSMYEAEVLVNKLDPSLFKPENCDTDVILKVNVAKDSIEVASYGYHADPRLEMVPVIGGDGHTHLVPVHYYEYLPVETQKFVKLINKDDKNVDNSKNTIVNYKKFKAELMS